MCSIDNANMGIFATPASICYAVKHSTLVWWANLMQICMLFVDLLLCCETETISTPRANVNKLNGNL